MLFYKIIEGSIEDISKLVIECVDLYLLDIGNHGHTSWETDSSIIKIYGDKPELMKCRSGLIHSHNTMKCFFSGEDEEELEDNSVGIDYYLSLIINNNAYTEWKAKIAIRGKEEITTISRFVGKLQELMGQKETIEKPVMFTYDLIIDVSADNTLAEIVKNTNEVEAKGKIDGRPKEDVKWTISPGYTPKVNKHEPIIISSKEMSEIDDTLDDRLYAQIFMGMPGVINSLSDTIDRMARHLTKSDQYAAFAFQKTEHAKSVIEADAKQPCTPEYIAEVLIDFISSVSKIQKRFSPDVAQYILCGVVVDTFESYITAQLNFNFEQ